MTQTHHTIAVHHVRQALLGAVRHGLAAEPLLERAGIAPALLDSPLARVSQMQFAALLRIVRRATRDELWGLLSRPVPLGTFAQGCRLLIHCLTLDEAMHAGFRHWHGAMPDFVPRLRVHDGAAHVTLPARVASNPRIVFAQRTFLFFSIGLASWLVGRLIPLQGVTYRGAQPPPAGAEIGRVFRASVAYNAPHFGYWFDARWLTLPVVQNAQSLAEFLQRAPADLLVRYRDQSNLTDRIRRLLRAHLRGELPSLEDVGRTLAMTPQTLRRRLREEGQGFQALKDDLRRDAAIEYLARPDLTLVDIAEQLGFSEASTFHRAFKKWTGVAPGEYRQRQR
jgi:AraC-like DNA-binding protein